MTFPDLLDAAVLCILGAAMCAVVLFVLIALHVIRHRPKDWMPCESWIVVGVYSLSWLGRILAG